MFYWFSLLHQKVDIEATFWNISAPKTFCRDQDKVIMLPYWSPRLLDPNISWFSFWIIPKSFQRERNTRTTRPQEPFLQWTLKNLRQATDIVIRSADKGRGVVIQDYEDYDGEALKILSDKEYYITIKEDPSKNIQMELNLNLTKAIEEEILTKNEKQFIYIPVLSVPFFYHIPKLHKSTVNPPGRPIISSINSPTCNLSHFIDLYLQDHVNMLPSHLNDSDDLIRHLQKVQLKEGLGLLTLDVTALYSNMNHDLGIECVEFIFFINSTHLYSFFIRFILEDNYFKYDNKIYHQVKGTAMGN